MGGEVGLAAGAASFNRGGARGESSLTSGPAPPYMLVRLHDAVLAHCLPLQAANASQQLVLLLLPTILEVLAGDEVGCQIVERVVAHGDGAAATAAGGAPLAFLVPQRIASTLPTVGWCLAPYAETTGALWGYGPCSLHYHRACSSRLVWRSSCLESAPTSSHGTSSSCG